MKDDVKHEDYALSTYSSKLCIAIPYETIPI